MRETHPGSEAFSAPMRSCRTCGAEKPWTRDYYGRRRMKRKDGSVYDGAWFLDCKTCETQRQLRGIEKKKAERAAEKARGGPPPPVAKALGSLPLPAPTKPNFRAVLEKKAEAKWDKLASKMVETALGSGKDSTAMLKLVAAYMLGTPREASEDDGPSEFWHALLASAGQRHAGTDPDLGAAGADLEHDPDPDGDGD
jgi:hypothetical protein